MSSERREVRATLEFFRDLDRQLRDERVLISTGVLVRAYSVVGQLGRDGAVELVSLEIDQGPPCPLCRCELVDLDVGEAPRDRRTRVRSESNSIA